MEIVVTTIASDGTVYRYLPVSMEDWDEALTRAYSYILTEQVCKNDSTIRIKSIERIDVPGPCCECGESTAIPCAICERPICYDCAKHSEVHGAPICRECKIKEMTHES